jgi:hypothetical protein
MHIMPLDTTFTVLFLVCFSYLIKLDVIESSYLCVHPSPIITFEEAGRFS